MKIIIIITVAIAVFSAKGDMKVIPVDGLSMCVHCPQPMDLDIADNIMKQTMRGLVPDNGPNYILVRTKSGKSIASHFYGSTYNINAVFKESDSDIEKNCIVYIIPDKMSLGVYGSGDDSSYGEASFGCDNAPVVVKKLRLGSVQYPRN